MNVLFVFLIIFTVIFLILTVKISFGFEFCNIQSEKYLAYVKVGFFKYTFFPLKEKRPRKAVPEKTKKKKKKEKKEEPEKEVKKPEKEKYNIREILEFVKAPLKKLVGKFKKYLRIEMSRINIRVASGDAFKTAMTFGAVSQAVYYIKELLEHNLNARIKNIRVESDFGGTKTKFDINLKISIRFYQIISIAFTPSVAFVKWIMRNKSKANKSGAGAGKNNANGNI